MELFYVALLTVPLYIQLGQFISVQVTLPTLYHQVPSSFILFFKRLHLNLLNIVNMLTLNAILGYHATRLKTISNIFKYKLSKSTITEIRILFSQLSVHLQKKYQSAYSSAFCSCIYYQNKTNGKKRTHGRSPRKSPRIGITLPYFSLDQCN